jgi:hypothetical protein
VESDPTRMCELLVGLPEMNVLAVDDEVGEMLRVSRRDPGRPDRVCNVRGGGPGEGPAGSRAGRSAVLRALDPAGVAQAPVVVPEVVFGRAAGRRRTPHRGPPHGHERPGRPMGHRTGRPLRPQRERGGHSSSGATGTP